VASPRGQTDGGTNFTRQAYMAQRAEAACIDFMFLADILAHQDLPPDVLCHTELNIHNFEPSVCCRRSPSSQAALAWSDRRQPLTACRSMSPACSEHSITSAMAARDGISSHRQSIPKRAISVWTHTRRGRNVMSAPRNSTTLSSGFGQLCRRCFHSRQGGGHLLRSRQAATAQLRG